MSNNLFSISERMNCRKETSRVVLYTSDSAEITYFLGNWICNNNFLPLHCCTTSQPRRTTLKLKYRMFIVSLTFQPFHHFSNIFKHCVEYQYHYFTEIITITLWVAFSITGFTLVIYFPFFTITLQYIMWQYSLLDNIFKSAAMKLSITILRNTVIFIIHLNLFYNKVWYIKVLLH
jgi:hypothetical protein